MSRSESPKIVVTSTSFSRTPVLIERLKQSFLQIKVNDHGLKLSGQALIDFIGDSDGLIVGLEHIEDSILSACPRLKVITKYGVGIDNIDQEACNKNKVAFCWTPGVNRLSVAEQALAFLIGSARNLFWTSYALKAGKWVKEGGTLLSQKTVGVIGVGNVGKELIRLLQPFGCKILVNDIIDQSSYNEANGLVSATQEEIFERSDFISLHVPLTKETRHLVNLTRLRSMKCTSYLINTARGPIIDQTALKTALKEGWIAGAALDVYDPEPPIDQEFLSLPNLICTPHIGGNAKEAVLAMGQSAIENMEKYWNNLGCG